MDGKRYAVETGRPQRPLKNQKGLQNINQSPDIKPRTEVSKRAYTARCKRAFLSLKSFCHSSCWKKLLDLRKVSWAVQKLLGAPKVFSDIFHIHGPQQPGPRQPGPRKPDPTRNGRILTGPPDPTRALPAFGVRSCEAAIICPKK